MKDYGYCFPAVGVAPGTTPIPRNTGGKSGRFHGRSGRPHLNAA